MSLATIRRLAADILKIGENRVRMKPDETKKVSEALTRGDVATLIREGSVYRIEKQGRRSTAKRKRRSWGRIRGRNNKRTKEEWMQTVRAQRKYLRLLLSDGTLPKEHKNSVYGKVKSGMFKTKKTMLIYLKENGMVKETAENKGKEQQ